MHLNLKKDEEYNYFQMPDGQPHIQLDQPRTQYGMITSSLSSMEEVFKLVLARNAGRFLPDCVLKITYLLGARQDKAQSGEALTVKIICDMINNLGFSRVGVLHPHSNAPSLLLNNFLELNHIGFVEAAVNDFRPDFLIIPDLGAAKNSEKYNKFELPQVQCYKRRDPKTGKLSGFGCYDEIPTGRGLVIDDICDGGGTFLGLSELFDNTLGLYTTHGLYTKGFTELNKKFEKTYCTDSYHKCAESIEEIPGYSYPQNKVYAA